MLIVILLIRTEIPEYVFFIPFWQTLSLGAIGACLGVLGGGIFVAGVIVLIGGIIIVTTSRTCRTKDLME
jgi:hypothetical protein